MVFDPKVYRDTKDGIGSPGDDAAVNVTDPNTMVALLKGMFNSLLTGISSTPSFTDDAAFTPGTTKTQPVAGTYRSARDAVDDGDAGTLAMNAKRGLYVTLEAADSTPLALNSGAASAATLRVISATDDDGVVSLQLIDDAIVADDAAFTPATTKVMMAGFEVDDTGTDSVDEGDAGAARMSANRNQYFQIRDGAGNERGVTVDASNRLNVHIGAAATAIAKAEDAASADADVGVPAMAVQKATPANTAGTDGDYEFLQMSAGRVWVSAVVTAAATSIGKAEDVASADADVGVPAMAIQKASPADTAGTDGDYAMLQMSAGRLWVSSTVTSVVPGTGATSLGKAEDGASADGDTGVGMLAVRKASPANTSGTDGDYEFLQMANGRLWTRSFITDGNDVVFLSAANALNSTGAGLQAVQIAGQFDDSSPTSITENQFGNIRMSANRNVYVTLRDAAGNERGLNIDASNRILSDVIGSSVQTISTTITRPNDSTAYAANDVFADSTSAPTSGGFTFTSAARASGGAGTITDAIVSASAGTAYQGEIWIFDQSVTAKNDNAAFDVSDSDVQKLVGIIPFNTNDTTSSNAVSYITGLNIGFTCVGTANLRFLVKIMAAITPGAQEVLAIRIKVQN